MEKYVIKYKAKSDGKIITEVLSNLNSLINRLNQANFITNDRDSIKIQSYKNLKP